MSEQNPPDQTPENEGTSGGTPSSEAPSPPEQGKDYNNVIADLVSGKQAGNVGGFANLPPDMQEAMGTDLGFSPEQIMTPQPGAPAGPDGPRQQFRSSIVQPPREQPVVEEEPGQHNVSEMEQLCKIGYATHTFPYGGKKITIHTLDQHVELEILTRIDRIAATARQQAHKVYTVAMCLDAVNGQPWFSQLPLGPNDDLMFERFKALLDPGEGRWGVFPATVTKIFNEHALLRRRTDEQAAYVKKG